MKNYLHDVVYFAPVKKMDGGWLCFKSSPSPPPPPDYTGAAQATAAGNADAARIGAKANRVSQYTPYGDLVYTSGVNGDQDQWRADVSLSPTSQQLLDINNQSSIKSGQLANQGLDYAGQILGKPGFDESMTPKAPVAPGQTAYDAAMARLTPQLDREKTSLDTQLINQGLRPGTEAYDNAMKLQNQKANDLQTQAAASTIPLDYQARQQAIQEQAFQQNQPVNIINAMRTGSQVQNPNFINPAQQTTTAGPDYLGAQSAQYGQQLGAFNAANANSTNQTNGILQAGAAIAPFFFSDRRLKTNIMRIGTTGKGLGIYQYDIFGASQIGVMADEVQKVIPQAVRLHPSGYYMVDYSMVG